MEAEYGMNDSEKKVVSTLANAFNLFCELKVEHPSDAREFEMAIHQAQNIVMARPAFRLMERGFEESSKRIADEKQQLTPEM